MIDYLLSIIAQLLAEPPRNTGGMSDAVLLSLIASFQLVAVAWINRGTKQAIDRSAEATLIKSEQVREAVRNASHNANNVANEVGLKLNLATVATENKLDEISKTTQETRQIVDTATGERLRLHAETSRRLAHITQKEECLKAAELAEQIYSDYLAKKLQADEIQRSS